MEYQTGQLGRVFYLRFDHGDDLLGELDALVRKEDIQSAWFHLFGGLGAAGVVTGPREATVPPEPVWQNIDGPREILATGSVFWGDNEPKIHLHAAMGHHGETLTGCVRKDTRIYLVVEAIVFELSGMEITRPWFTKGQFYRPYFHPGNRGDGWPIKDEEQHLPFHEEE